jgi:hypothetical protein
LARGFALVTLLVWQAECDTRGVASVAIGLLGSPEFITERALTLGNLVTALYRALLGRAPTAVEGERWLLELRPLRRRGAITIVRSEEFRPLVPQTPAVPADVAAAMPALRRHKASACGARRSSRGMATVDRSLPPSRE